MALNEILRVLRFLKFLISKGTLVIELWAAFSFCRAGKFVSHSSLILFYEQFKSIRF